MAGRTNPTQLTVNSQRVFAGLKNLIFGIWTKDPSTNADVAPDMTSGTWYDVRSIIGDTTSVEQAENEVSAIESEFTPDPLYENATIGEKTFSCELLNLNAEVLEDLFGWDVDSAGNAIAPSNVEDKYVTVEMTFKSTNDTIVLPKVKLNSTVTLASLKTDAGKAMISGTCYSTDVTIGSDDYTTDEFVLASGQSYSFGTGTGA